jgi:tetratricopeptide (TPR) repeat protein
MPPASNIAAGAPAGVILERGQAIDRFVVLGLVGRGGMGEVYAAYDPELDRKVAIKLLRASGSSAEGKTRLLREAQAIAKLQHPNVVVVYDVGTFGDSVFIAMEFVDGRTVSGWLHAGKRTRREILDVYLAAGRGLAAAHAAGLVHRDFKPDNVMVTNDGQVRVMDFGLARQIGEAAAEAKAASAAARATASAAPVAETFDEALDPESTANLNDRGTRDLATTSGKYLSVKLTQTGAMMGTPAYMAPEQFAVAPTDARTDQFSFCVALYEALYGQRPFAGTTFLSLMTSVTTGAVNAPPAGAKVAGWMRRVLLRGLATEPKTRFESMTALLAALSTDPTVRVKRGLGVVLMSVALVAALIGFRRVGGAQQAMCGAGAERLAGIWEPAGTASPRKAAIHAAFLATGKSFAQQAFVGASRYLDEFVGSWLGMYREACEATHVRGEQSAEVLDLRMGCLHDRLVDLRALTDAFATANDKIVENAVSATSSLSGVEQCANVPLLRAVVKPPADEATRRQVEHLREEKARLLAIRHTAKCDEGRKLEADLLRAARQTGYLPLLAESLAAASMFEDACGGASETELALDRETYTSAIASGADRVAAEAALLTATALADRARNLDAARGWLDIGRAMVTRTGGDDPLRANLDQAEGALAQNAGDTDAALASWDRCRIDNEKAHGPDHPYVAVALIGTGLTYQAAGKLALALAAFRRAGDILTKAIGPDHPMTAINDSDAGEVLNGLGRFPEARASFEHAVGVWTAQHADPAITAYGETGLGLALLGEGRPQDALAPLERALEARTTAKAAPELLGETRFALARALWSRPSARERARALARTARADYATLKDKASTVAAIDAWLVAPRSHL